ncbi:sulfur carrier protein ThiS [Algibacter miyuki]|uniref:Sulfur carrier protein ThiS n=1 Tax=Algibacter miyuki TaxID=1306933 RepID=A0ABV5GZ83_9FLAO|nr:sulfur carrier protein ThiS [Algibacter miyuki]MDN3666833.1 sulfur carrier protein ThiS [Algibacter miyuki]
MINIKVNNQNHKFKVNSTLDQVLDMLDISPQGIALAVNQDIITKALWKTYTLTEGDSVLIITATQGG